MDMYLKILWYYNSLYPYIKRLRGSYRLKKFLEMKVKRKYNEKTIELEIYDTRMLAPRKTNQAFALFTGYRELNELNNIEYLLKNIDPNDIFIDIGSSFGLFSSVISNRTKAKVISYEILTLNIKFQELNQELFKYEFKTQNKAVSNKEGKNKINVSSSTHGQNYLKSGKNTAETQKVESVKIDNEINKADYIKIDVEGAELKVLKGMEEVIKKSKPTILLELHSSEKLNRFNTKKTDIIKYLNDLNYQSPTIEELEEGDNNLIIEYN